MNNKTTYAIVFVVLTAFWLWVLKTVWGSI
jgi:hypothetical protein